MTTCERCGTSCEDRDIVWRLVSRQTMSSPAEHDMVGCACCMGGDDRDEEYERLAARDRLDGFARTGGRDWT